MSPKSRRLTQCAAAVLLLALSQLALKSNEEYYPQPDSNSGWRSLTDPAKIRKKTGIDTQKLDEAFEYTKQTSQHGGLLVVRHGYLVYEKYFGRGNREALPELASCGKAFTTVATGIMLREKHDLIPNGLDEKVISPKYLPAEYFPVDDKRKEQISLGQLLSMSAGIRGTNPVYVKGVRQTWEHPTEENGPWTTTDDFAMKQSLWCAPGECY